MVFDAQIIESPDWDFYIWPLITLFSGNFLLGIWAQLFGKKDNSWIDVMWAISFVTPNLVILKLRADQGLLINNRMYLATALVSIWMLLLSTYIFFRHKSEDYRYK